MEVKGGFECKGLMDDEGMIGGMGIEEYMGGDGRMEGELGGGKEVLKGEGMEVFGGMGMVEGEEEVRRRKGGKIVVG